jgi:hypothetical protein
MEVAVRFASGGVGGGCRGPLTGNPRGSKLAGSPPTASGPEAL